MNDTRLRKAPVAPKGAEPRPFSCYGPGHDSLGYPCHGATDDPNCLRYVCQRCARKQEPYKARCELCNICWLATQHGGSMQKATATIAELNPTARKRGKTGCASTAKNASPCRRCIRHTCKHCDNGFRSHSNRSAYCGDLCRSAAAREANRRRQEDHRQKRLVA